MISRKQMNEAIKAVYEGKASRIDDIPTARILPPVFRDTSPYQLSRKWREVTNCIGQWVSQLIYNSITAEVLYRSSIRNKVFANCIEASVWSKVILARYMGNITSNSADII